ncbi:MAG: nitroreductase [Candidatus Rokuibacteriota bacterium]|nr:MAG: nitroreductase [Candidatus Rokubacteria bacterium]
MAEEIGLFDAMYTQRALRYISPEPIPDALIRKVLDAGIRAPNGGNQQRWRFIVIKDEDTKRWIRERYQTTDRPAHAAPRTAAESRSAARNDAAANHLADHLHEVPVLILCCVQHDGSPSDINRGASIYPAVQNMLLAARGLGLASVLTTRPRRGFEQEIKAKLRIPDNVDTAALLPLGYIAPGHRYGPTTRRPVEEVTFDETWGRPWEAGR